MKIEITIDGKTYITKCGEESAKEIADGMYEKFDVFTKLKTQLEDGSYLLIGKEAVQRAVIIVKP